MGLLFGSAGAHSYLKSGQVAPSPSPRILETLKKTRRFSSFISGRRWGKFYWFSMGLIEITSAEREWLRGAVYFYHELESATRTFIFESTMKILI